MLVVGIREAVSAQTRRRLDFPAAPVPSPCPNLCPTRGRHARAWARASSKRALSYTRGSRRQTLCPRALKGRIAGCTLVLDLRQRDRRPQRSLWQRRHGLHLCRRAQDLPKEVRRAGRALLEHGRRGGGGAATHTPGTHSTRARPGVGRSAVGGGHPRQRETRSTGRRWGLETSRCSG